MIGFYATIKAFPLLGFSTPGAFPFDPSGLSRSHLLFCAFFFQRCRQKTGAL